MSTSNASSDPSKRVFPVESGRTPNRAGQVQTVLTAEAEFRGSLAFSGDLRLDGKLEGTIESEGGCLIIGEDAVVKAEIKVERVVVYGKVLGNITAPGGVEVRGQAQVYGDLRSNRIALDETATFVGRSEILSKSQKPPDFAQIFSRLNTPGGTATANGSAARHEAKHEKKPEIETTNA